MVLHLSFEVQQYSGSYGIPCDRRKPEGFLQQRFQSDQVREQEKWHEVTFPPPPAKLKNLFKWELSPKPLDRNLFELRVNQKQF